MWVPMSIETSRSPNPYTAILRARTDLLSVERSDVRVRKIGMFSGESTSGKSAPTISNEVRMTSSILSIIGGKDSFVRKSVSLRLLLVLPTKAPPNSSCVMEPFIRGIATDEQHRHSTNDSQERG